MNDDVLALAAGLRGNVIIPESDGYDDARRVWNGTVDKRPQVIVRCRGVADVLDAVRYARSTGLGVSVRGGGHRWRPRDRSLGHALGAGRSRQQ